MRACSLFPSLILFLAGSAVAATVIHVPADQPTIQAAIIVANNGDTVLVSPGTYTENINFLGKAITVMSSNGPKVTIIDGGGLSSVVTFSTNEGLSSVLSGFTLQNGNAMNTPEEEGGGIAIEGASPTIKGNIIERNFGANAGGGIGIGFASPVIQENIIRNNSQTPTLSGGVGGGGISVRGGESSAQIIRNLIQNNTWNNDGAGFGGGISVDNSGSTLIENNIIEGNVAGTWGAAISMENLVYGTSIVQNLITGNSSPDDAGIYWSNPPGMLVNNTITDGEGSTGSSTSIVVANGFDSSIIMANNVIVATKAAANAFYCVSGDIQNPLNFYNNDIFSSKGAPYGGLCTDQTGVNGNISISPDFVSKSNFRLKGGSPAIDVGNNAAPDLPSRDLVGDPRIINGNDGPTAIIDMGAYEFLPVTLSPKSLNFGTQAIGSTTTKTVTLTNAQDKSLSISSKTVPSGYEVSGCGSSVAAFSSCSLTVTFHPLKPGVYKGTLTVKDNAGNSPQIVSLSGTAQ